LLPSTVYVPLHRRVLVLQTAGADELPNLLAVPLAPRLRSERLGEGIGVTFLEGRFHLIERNHFETAGGEAMHDRGLGAVEEWSRVDLRARPLRVARRPVDGEDGDLPGGAEARLIEVEGRFLPAPANG
jgi:hypothetical protein